MIFPSDRVSIMPGSKYMAFKLVFSVPDGRVLGAQAIGAGDVAKRIDVIAAMITMGADLEDLKDVELCYAPPFSTAKDAENIKVLGRGVIDSSPYKRIQEYTDSDAEGEEILNELKKKNVSRGIGNVLMIDCKNVLIDGLVFRDPPEWSYNIYHCENVRINDVKLIGLWRYNADGIDIYLGRILK